MKRIAIVLLLSSLIVLSGCSCSSKKGTKSCSGDTCKVGDRIEKEGIPSYFDDAAK